MFSSTDVKAMETKMSEILKATALMEKAREWLGPAMQAVPALSQKLIGDMDVRLVMHVHGFAKKVKTRVQYPSLEAIAHEFVREVGKNGGDLSTSPWKLPAAPPAASAQKEPGSINTDTIARFAADGSLDVGQLKSVFGFELGITVQLKEKGGTVHHIAKVESRAVTLIAGDSSKKILTPGELVDLYKVIKVEEDIVIRSKEFLSIQSHPESRSDCMRLSLIHI